MSTPQAKLERSRPTKIVNTNQSKSEKLLPEKYGGFNDIPPQNTNQSVFSQDSLITMGPGMRTGLGKPLEQERTIVQVGTLEYDINIRRDPNRSRHGVKILFISNAEDTSDAEFNRRHDNM